MNKFGLGLLTILLMCNEEEHLQTFFLCIHILKFMQNNGFRPGQRYCSYIACEQIWLKTIKNVLVPILKSITWDQ